MTHYEFRYSAHPRDVDSYSTEALRKHFLIDNLFSKDQINWTYTMYDRYIVGGALPRTIDLKLETIPYLKADRFLDRREMGIINVGGKGSIKVDGDSFELSHKEALYIAKGTKNVIFERGENPIYYINSAPAHHRYQTTKIGKSQAEIVELGDSLLSNQRTIYKLIVNSIVPTCQLQMGLTELKPGSVWNTMPAHTHERRMEIYFYFELLKEQTVCHFMGQPQQTRHLFVQNHQAVISPEWSIHCGAGTSNYTFIWAMAGENLDYSDMDVCPVDKLR